MGSFCWMNRQMLVFSSSEHTFPSLQASRTASVKWQSPCVVFLGWMGKAWALEASPSKSTCAGSRQWLLLLFKKVKRPLRIYRFSKEPLTHPSFTFPRIAEPTLTHFAPIKFTASLITTKMQREVINQVNFMSPITARTTSVFLRVVQYY
jgi:hypothetical protein